MNPMVVGRIVVAVIVLALIIAGIVFFFAFVVPWFKSTFQSVFPVPTKAQGQECSAHNQCIGFEQGQIGCCGDCTLTEKCKKTCQPFLQDHAGNWYCRNEAVLTYGTVPVCKRVFKDEKNGRKEYNFWRCEKADGTIVDGTDWCREPGECQGYGILTNPGNTCCDSHCVAKKDDGS